MVKGESNRVNSISQAQHTVLDLELLVEVHSGELHAHGKLGQNNNEQFTRGSQLEEGILTVNPNVGNMDNGINIIGGVNTDAGSSYFSILEGSEDNGLTQEEQRVDTY
ncbi:unnamed protein product [Dovyalis caffra]|uniref:Uncharacterized protein n=1 Tax=Dovyalis caffra TaxID=77055 RepID=A0AAV1RFJ1_9ROSI|nr:unnamed protein product [Dovyalis caffra]